MPPLSSIFVSSILILTILFSYTLAQGFDNEKDQRCERGLCAGRVCCPKMCGVCGGKGCGRRGRRLGLGSQCCNGWIKKKSGRSCSEVGPPCLLKKQFRCKRTPSASPSPQPTGQGSRPGEWTNITASLKGLPTKRHENCFVMAHGNAYLIGGRGKRPVEMYNPKAKTWTKVAQMPTQMHHMQCVVYGRDIYIPTSWYGSSPTESNNEYMWKFNVDNYKWTKLTGLPEPRRRGGAASVIAKNRIYVIGGNRGGHGPPSKSYGWVDYYDLKTRKWVTGLSSLPRGHERDHVGGALVRGKICIAGGRNGGMENPFGATVSSTFCYDVDKDNWQNMNAPIPAARAGAATGTSCDGRMIIIGGEGRYSRAFNQVDAFDGKSWETLAPLKRQRHGTGVAISDCSNCGHMFIVAGSGARGGRPELTSTELNVPKGGTKTCERY